MNPPRVAYMDATIFLLIVRVPSGFSCAVVVTDANDKRRGFGDLGVFARKVVAYRPAIAYGKSETERRCLLTLVA
jgi:hypothetical protein